MSGAKGPIEGMYASMLAASVKLIVNPLAEPTVTTPKVEL
jgi:hypothetical protein